jgi:flagellar motility protein MotE (MotC chaperone)
MNNAAKYALLAVGGLVITFGSFVTFAALSGAPLHEVALIKKFIQAPEEAGSEHRTSAAVDPAHASPQAVEAPGGGRASAEHAERQPSARAIEASMGALGAFVIPAPYSSEEFSDLQKELREGQKSLRERMARIEARERSLDEWEQSLQQRFDELNEMREQLVQREIEMGLRESEAKRDLESSKATEQQSWKDLAKFFEEGDLADLSAKLAGFQPEEAARILHALPDERASELVNALPAEKYHAYLAAYRVHSSKPN